MPTSHRVQAATRNQPSLLRAFHLVRDEGISVKNGPFWEAVWGGARIFAVVALLITASGCLATCALGSTIGCARSQASKSDSKPVANNLHLERRLVLDSSTGPTFAFGSAALSGNAKREIDGFFQDLEGSHNSGSAASERIFVVAGYTDSVGPEDYNYELGQRRATSVAGYLVGKKGWIRRRFTWPPTARASQSPTTPQRGGGEATAGSKFSSIRRKSLPGAERPALNASPLVRRVPKSVSGPPRTIRLHPPGRPMENGYIESFKGQAAR